MDCCMPAPRLHPNSTRSLVTSPALIRHSGPSISSTLPDGFSRDVPGSVAAPAVRSTLTLTTPIIAAFQQPTPCHAIEHTVELDHNSPRIDLLPENLAAQVAPGKP